MPDELFPSGTNHAKHVPKPEEPIASYPFKDILVQTTSQLSAGDPLTSKTLQNISVLQPTDILSSIADSTSAKV